MANFAMNEFCWNELATRDVQKAKDFYGSVFGWQFKDVPIGDMVYTMIKTQDKEFGGIWHIPDDKQDKIPPHWMAYILVANAEEALAKAKQKGAQVVKEVIQVSDMGRFAIFIDPTGAHIAVWENLSNK